LRLAENRAPLAVALLDFERVGGLDLAGLQPTQRRDQRERPGTCEQNTPIEHG